jgi:hypothetical protein
MKVISAYKILSGVAPAFSFDANGNLVEDPVLAAQDLLYLQDAIQQILYFTHTPVIMSFRVTKKIMEDARFKTQGDLRVPTEEEFKREEQKTYHAVLIVGYDNDAKMFKFRNSYGPEWGVKGHGRMPYAYLKHTSDAFIICEQGSAESTDQPSHLSSRSLSSSNNSSSSSNSSSRSTTESVSPALRHLGSIVSFKRGKQPKDLYPYEDALLQLHQRMTP